MSVWTLITMVDLGKVVRVDQVTAPDLRSAIREWGRVVKVPGMTPDSRKRLAEREPPEDAEEEFVCRWEWKGVWTFQTDFGFGPTDTRPPEWGEADPMVWAVKTDVRNWIGDHQGDGSPAAMRCRAARRGPGLSGRDQPNRQLNISRITMKTTSLIQRSISYRNM